MSRTKGTGCGKVSGIYKNRRYFARKRGELPEPEYQEGAEKALKAAGI